MMVSPTFWFMKLIIFFVLLCTFVRISSTQPLLDDNDDEDQTKLYSPFFKNYVAALGRLTSNTRHKFHIPQHIHDDHQQKKLLHQTKEHHPDSEQLTKRIIMLPRVGRRSI
ncbi:unnamed protein product [Rotaria sp. Silwood1]|nr:unnamed protein product [Rotaria sp. Silwood1]CAF1464800.1 unnamed protein product [Rotaria sp. Silwood1]CAF1467195.1 unnamed protein product [Rotaria sp. Silwood1]